MSLKKKIAKLEEVAEPLREFYRQEGKDFVLIVEGGEEDGDSKAQIKEFRDNNLSLRKQTEDLQAQLAAFGEIKPEEVKVFREQQEKIKRKELLDKGDIDALLTAEKEKISTAFGKRLDAVQQKNEELEKTLVKLRVTDELSKAAAVSRVKPEAIGDVVELASREWFLEDGGAVRKKGKEIVLSKTEVGRNQSMEEFFLELAEKKPYYFEASGGGGGQSPAILKGKVMRNPTPLELGANAAAIEKGEIRVEYDAWT
ncbi:MAG: hypothetical protein ABIJ57_13430 [Pseudomonadota bacterium]